MSNLLRRRCKRRTCAFAKLILSVDKRHIRDADEAENVVQIRLLEMSRSAFALRFKELLGETPLEYLTNWRMYKATGFLQDADKKLFEVAKSVGYDSDAAFSKAFKRVLGVAPREYRRSAAGAE